MSENKLSIEEIKKSLDEHEKLVSEKVEQIHLVLNGLSYRKIKNILSRVAMDLPEKVILHI